MNDNLPKNVVMWHGLTALGITPDRMLIANIGEFDTLVLCGIDKNGELVLGSSVSSFSETLGIMERVKAKYIRSFDE